MLFKPGDKKDSPIKKNNGKAGHGHFLGLENNAAKRKLPLVVSIGLTSGSWRFNLASCVGSKSNDVMASTW